MANEKLVIALDPRTAARARKRAELEGYRSLEQVIEVLLVYRYAFLKDAGAGGYARARKMTKRQRSEAARLAATAKWKDTTPEERKKAATRASDARWRVHRQMLALARKVAEPEPEPTPRRRVPGWPLVEGED